MPTSEPTRTPARRARSTIPAALVVSAALVGALGFQTLAPSASSLASPSPSVASPSAEATVHESPAPEEPPIAAPPLGRRADPPAGDRATGLGEADGAVPEGVAVFDGAVPAVAHLDPALVGALRRAASDAAADGVTFAVTSGWRSPAYQAHLLRDAVSTYGSEAEAARWVATPETSAHVSGDAVDLGSAAAAWLVRNGAAYGLCPVYDNEPWHYERRPDAADKGCPARYADPTHDPRMRP